MINKILVILLCVKLLIGCSSLNRYDFVTTENIAQIDNEAFIYSVYQIDYDSFNILFKVVVDNDTSEIFTANIPDGIYSKNSFNFKTAHDTLIVFDPRQTRAFYYKTKKGTTIKHTN